MQDMVQQLEKLLTEASECALIADLTTDKDKRALFAKLSEHYAVLAAEVRKAIEQTAGKSQGSHVRELRRSWVRQKPRADLQAQNRSGMLRHLNDRRFDALDRGAFKTFGSIEALQNHLSGLSEKIISRTTE